MCRSDHKDTDELVRALPERTGSNGLAAEHEGAVNLII